MNKKLDEAFDLFSSFNFSIFSKVGGQHKMNKSFDYGIITMIVHLLPSTKFEGKDACPMSSPLCRRHCLVSSGMGKFKSVYNGRARKSDLFWNHRSLFEYQLRKELNFINYVAGFFGIEIHCRLNGTSDIMYEKIMPWIFTDFPAIRFYEYTKFSYKEKLPYLDMGVHYTFSIDEREESIARGLTWVENGYNVAVIGNTKAEHFPDRFYGFAEIPSGLPVIDGTKHDIRIGDPRPAVVMLEPLGSLSKIRKSKIMR